MGNNYTKTNRKSITYIKRSFKIFLLSLFMFICYQNAYSQCYTCRTLYPSATQSTTSSCWATVSSIIYFGEYSHYDLNTNYIYQWWAYGTSSNADTYITLNASNSCSGSAVAYNDDCGGIGTLQSVVAYTPGETFVSALLTYYQAGNYCNNDYEGTSVTTRWRAFPRTPSISPSAATICSGLPVTLSTAQICENDAWVNVQWSTDNFATILNGDATSITVSPTVNTTYYMRYQVVACGAPGTQYSNIASVPITVVTSVVGTISGLPATICEKSTASITYNPVGGETFVRFEGQLDGISGTWFPITTSSPATIGPSNGYGGSTLYIRAVVNNAGCGETYSTPISTYIIPSPGNDDCANAIVIPSSFPYSSGILTTECATDDNIIGSSCNPFSTNVWFKVIGTGNLMEANTCDANTNFDTEIRILTGTCGTFSEVACNDDYCGLQSNTQWCSVLGQEYYISIGCYFTNYAFGNYVLNVLDYPVGIPINVATSDDPICAGGSVTLSATPGTNGDNIYWYTNGCGNNFVGTGTSLVVNPGVTTTYYARTYNSGCGNFSDQCQSVTVNVVTDPTVTITGAADVCVGGSVTLTANVSGGIGSIISYQWTRNGSNVGGNSSTYTTDNSLPAGNYAYAVIVTQTGNGCGRTSASVNANVIADPAKPTATMSPDLATVCAGQILTLSGVTDNGGGAGICNFWYRANGGTWTTTLPSITATVGTNTIEIKKVCDGSGCEESGITLYSWTVVADPAVPSATKSPDVASVCAGQLLTLTGVTDNGGGTGSCSIWYRANSGTWTTTLPSFAATVGTNTIEVKKVCDGSGCDESGILTLSWNVSADPATPTATKSPDVANVCEGQILTLTGVNDNGGGTGTCNLWYSANGGAWTTTLPSFVATIGTNTIEIKKVCDGSGCDESGISAYSWNVFADPAMPTATKLPDVANVCAGQLLTLTGVTDNGGGTGTCEIWYSINGGAWSTTFPSYIATIGTNTIAIRKICNGTGCDESVINTFTWNVFADPIAPTAQKVPNALTVCVGQPLSLINVTDNGSGAGNCNIEYSINGGAWSTTLTPFAALEGTNTIDIRKVCDGLDCQNSTINSFSWDAYPDPYTPIATKSPNVETVCTGQILSLSGVIDLGGGAGNCFIEYRHSINGGLTWTPWSATPSNFGSVTGTNIIEIRKRCTGMGCDISPVSSFSWGVLEGPSAPSATKLPDVESVCIGQMITITDVVDNGGGSGNCIIEYSANGGSWSTIIPNFAASSGTNTIALRKTCDGSGCPASAITTYTWTGASDPVVSVTAVPLPICSGETSTLTATPSGGAGIYSYQWQQWIGSSWVNVGTDSPTYTTPALTSSSDFHCLYIPVETGCNTITSNVLTVIISPTVGTPSSISIIAGSEPVCQLSNGTTTTTYSTTATDATGYNWSINNPAAGIIDPITGVMTWADGFSGAVNIQVTANGCNGPSSQVIRIVDVTPSVGTPVFVLGGASTICQGSANITYTANCSNTTGITYTLSASGTSSINNATGEVTWDPSYVGDATITATAAGCNGPTTAVHVVTITPSVEIPVFVLGGTSTICQGSANITYTANCSNTTGITYTLSASGTSSINNATGEVTWDPSYAGDVTITATAAGCNGPTTAAHVVTITPSVEIPVFVLGSASTICQGSANITYTANCSNTTGITYTLSASGTSSINNATGEVTWDPSYTGQATITATAAGCNGPTTTDHVVTITPSVGIPVFALGGTTTICQGSPNITYTASSSNSTGITYSLSASGTSSINNTTGEVTWDPSYVGDATITAIAAGCNGPTTANHVVTITPSVGIPVFDLGSSSSICEGASPITYTAISANNTGITYSLDATSIAGGNSINPSTGEVVWAPNWNGSSSITATATGCNGPVSAIHTVLVNDILPVNVGITASPGIAVCSGTLVTFTATTVNAGSSPAYTWRVNGNIVGSNSSVFSSSSLVMSDHITCEVSSSIACVSNNPATSGTITMIVKPSFTAGVSIQAFDNPTCTHTVVNFAATAINGGTTPNYQWFVNSNPYGSNSSTYSNNSLMNGDTVSCRLTSNEGCVVGNPAYSNDIIMVMNLLPNVDAGTDATYSGTPVVLGSPTNGPGTFSWQPVTGLNDPNLIQPEAIPLMTTTYTLTVDNLGCTATDEVTVSVVGTGHVISGKTRYAGKANVGSPTTNPPTYNAIIYDINAVIVGLFTYPGLTELARDTSDALGIYQFNNIPDGTYKLVYDKYTADTMQWVNDANALDVAQIKYRIGSDSATNPSRYFTEIHKRAADINNDAFINALDVAKIKTKIGSPYDPAKNFKKGNWPILDTIITVSGSDMNVTLKTISYGDYNATSSMYRDSSYTWSLAKSMPVNIIDNSGETIMVNNPDYFEIPLSINTKINEFSAMGLELNYQNNRYKLVSASMVGTNNKSEPVKINPTFEEIINEDNDLLVTDENGVIRVVYATTNHFDVAKDQVIINFGFRPLYELNIGELEFVLSGTGVFGDQYGVEYDEANLIMPKLFVQGGDIEAGFELTAYPNPFNGEATISYMIPEKGAIKLNVYNAIGELVDELVNENQGAGKHTVLYNHKGLSAGMYTFKLEFIGVNKTKCMVLKLIH